MERASQSSFRCLGVEVPGDGRTGRGERPPVRDALTQLPVREENRTGYQRSKFKHWIGADRDGCNTRAEIVKAEAAVTVPEQGPNCRLTGGVWYSPCDGHYIEDPAAWTSTTSSPSPKPGTPAPHPGRPRNARPTPTTSETTATSSASQPPPTTQKPTRTPPPGSPGRRLPLHLHHRLDRRQDPLEPDHRHP